VSCENILYFDTNEVMNNDTIVLIGWVENKLNLMLHCAPNEKIVFVVIYR